MRRLDIRRWAALLGGGLVAGCALLTPLPPETGVEARLAQFPRAGLPIAGAVTVHWDDHQIPFVVAERDEDAAFALGLVHAHLRLGQMEIFRRIARGRIAEMGGPLAADIDHGLRVLDFGRAAAESEARLPAATRSWLDRFVAGINHYQRQAVALPHEYAVLGFEREPWTVADVLTFGRLAGTDVNWLVWFNLLKLRGRDDWPELWARLIENGSDSVPSFAAAGADPLAALLAGVGRTGSNSLAVAPSRSRTGAAIMANDPHLGIQAPNTWLIAGVKSPSLHAVGLMVPGLPFFAIGRNPHIAWGGTNMRAAASDLVDASELDAADLVERRERIAVRWWFDREVTVRDTPWGPMISDAPQVADPDGRPLALRWTGHQPSDEVTAMLRANRARTFDEFRAAFESFAVPGQNMLYADVDGTIGQVMAVRLPARDGTPPNDLIQDPDAVEPSWSAIVGVGELPYSIDPERGFLASANNRPASSEPPVGYFFSHDDRVRRMATIIADAGRVGLDDVKAMQRDTYMDSAVALRDAIVDKATEAGIAADVDAPERAVLDRMAAWDGHYRVSSRGAVAFELVRHRFTAGFYESVFGAEDWAAFANVGRIKSLLLDDVRRRPAAELAPLLAESLAHAAERLDDFADWGDMHRLRIAHPLSFLPVVGSRYRFAEYPIGGSTDTLMKTAHGSTDERHTTRYGSNARHVSDLSDADANEFVLLGGQDGWINSTTFADQVPLWLAGEYIRVPLRVETVGATFPHTMVLEP